MTTVGVIGTGAMGGAIAARLLASGFSTHVRDLIASRVLPLAALGAIAHDSSASLARAARCILIVVVDAAQINDVIDGAEGIAQALGPGHVVVLCSTIAPHDTERFARRVADLGADLVDAPISGGPARARDGTMSMMLAAAGATLARIADVLAAASARRFVVSPRPGDGARAKLVNNLAAGVHLAAAAEALGLAVRLGLAPEGIAALMSASSGQSWIADDRVPRALAGDLEPRARLAVLTKDLRLADEAARRVGVRLALGGSALVAFDAACDAGDAEADDAVLVARALQARR